MRPGSEKHVIGGSKNVHWIGLYLSFHLNRVLDPFVHGRAQNHNPFNGSFGPDAHPGAHNDGIYKSRFDNLRSDLSCYYPITFNVCVRDSCG